MTAETGGPPPTTTINAAGAKGRAISTETPGPVFPDLCGYALAYAEQGQPVFPCSPADIVNDDGTVRRAKTPLTSNGHLAATTDLDQLKTWWSRWKFAAIGLPTGIHWDVLDVDKKPGGVNGYTALNFLIDIGLIRDGAVRIVESPTGGLHVYYPASGSMTNASFGSRGIDLRGVGGYVIAPPSILFDSTGRVRGSYVLKSERPIEEGAPLDHERIRTLLRDPREKRLPKPGGEPADAGSLIHWLGLRGRGDRNTSLFWTACRLVETGDDPDVLLETAVEIGLSEQEARRTIASARRKASA